MNGYNEFIYSVELTTSEGLAFTNEENWEELFSFSLKPEQCTLKVFVNYIMEKIGKQS